MLPRKNFYGQLEGKSIYDFTRELDYSLSLENRLNILNNRLYDNEGKQDPFFDELFMQDDGENTSFKSHINLLPTNKECVYSETNIAKELEKMADYLLFAYDKENDNKDTVDYVILTEKELEQRTKLENSFVDRIEEEGKMLFIQDASKNYKLEIKQKIYKQDLEEETQCGKILRNYQKAIDTLTFEIRKSELMSKLSIKTNGFSKLETLDTIDELYLAQYGISKENLNYEYINQLNDKIKNYRKIAKDMRGDMLYSKDHLKGTIYFKQALGDSTEIAWDLLDWDNPEQVKELLKIQKGENFDNEIGCMMYDLGKIIKRAKLTKVEKDILKLYRQGNMTLEEIGEIMQITKQAVTNTIDRVVKKLISTYWTAMEDDWYYVSIVKGNYKTCKCCGKAKLISKFSPESKSKDGYKTVCKKCRRSK